jgi:ketosteroid isomerase-like protein
MRETWRQHLSNWEGWHTGPIDELIARDDRVVTIALIQGRGKYSGVEIGTRAGAVFTFRDGKVVRLELVNDRAKALEAAGLAEPPAVTLIRRSYEAFNRGDYDDAIALTPLDYELHIAQDGVGVGAGIEEVYRGHDGLHDAIEDFVSPFESLRYEPEELIDLGDRVVVLLHMVARGRGSGAETRQTLGIAYEVEDGVPVRERHFWEWRNALESVGLDD